MVRDLPWTGDKLRKLPPFEFEKWAVIALAEYPTRHRWATRASTGGDLPRLGHARKCGGAGNWASWKRAQGRPDIDAFEAAMMRTDRKKGYFISFDYSSDAMEEISRFFKQSGRSIIARR